MSPLERLLSLLPVADDDTVIEAFADAIADAPIAGEDWNPIHAAIRARLGDTDPRSRSVGHELLIAEAWQRLCERDCLAWARARTAVLSDLRLAWAAQTQATRVPNAPDA